MRHLVKVSDVGYKSKCVSINTQDNGLYLLLSVVGIWVHFPVSPLNSQPWNGHWIQSPITAPPTARCAPRWGQYASTTWARPSSPRNTAKFKPRNIKAKWLEHTTVKICRHCMKKIPDRWMSVTATHPTCQPAGHVIQLQWSHVFLPPRTQGWI